MRNILLSILLCAWVSAHAVSYCASGSWGYCGNVTGGGNSTPTLVKSESELKNALKNNNSVIIITKDITVTYRISVEVSNMTLLALPGVSITSNQRNRANSGIFIFKGSSNNIILRNLTLKGPGAYDCNGFDLLSLEGATNVWVDHCDFQDGMDGNFDIKSPTDNVTVTWCRFRYFIDPIPRGEGGDSDDHRFSNLIGSDSDNAPNDGTFNVTYGFCWWDEGCRQRMTRCRNSELHFLNCYWNSSVADYYIGPENAKCYFEGCTFVPGKNTIVWSPFNGSTNSCKFVNCSGYPSNSGSVSAPSYSYDKLKAAQAVEYVTNSSCGAGATLTITTDGKVSSSCPDEDPGTGGGGGETPDPTPSAMTWNINDAAFDGLTSISSEQTVNGLHMVATSEKTITFDNIENPITRDGFELKRRLKLGGSGAATHRHLWFNVTGKCTITVYMASSGTDDRVLNIDKGEFGSTVATLTAPSYETASVSKQSYSYTGGATKLYLYSTNKGINIFGINIVYSGSATDIETPSSKDAAQKVLRDGQLLIFRDGRTYTVLGLNQ